MRVPANHWYPLLESRELRKRPLGLERLGRVFAFWRTADGTAHANLDRCPHLGASLSAGRIEGDQIVCPFHGFRFNQDGRCTHIPSVGRNGRIPPGLAVESFAVREAHGFVWVWWGSQDRIAPELPWFPQLDATWRHHTVMVDWPVHYTRAIENQLDVAHLAFVHRTTIGAGGRSLVEGPHVEADANRIRVWTTNRRDDGPARSPAELAAAAANTRPSLDFLFPGVWLLDLGDRFNNLIAFVPINEQTTRYYLRSYHRIGSALLARPFEWIMSLSNRYILSQDRRVVVTQTPASSLDAHEDRLVSADRAINLFRKMHARQLEPD